MEIVEYSDKSFAVYGDTKPYKDELKELGGRYNANLRDGPGWIFSNTKLSAVEEFFDAVKEPSPKSSPKVNTNAPKTYSKPAPKTYTRPVVKPRATVPKITPMNNISMNDNSKTFIGQDKVEYQIIVTVCPLPHIGQIITVDSLDKTLAGDYEIIIISDLPDQNFGYGRGNGDDELVGSATIINGRWQLKHVVSSHEIIFHP